MSLQIQAVIGGGLSSELNAVVPDSVLAEINGAVVRGKDGVSIVDIYINSENHIICVLSNGETVDAGAIVSSGYWGSITGTLSNQADLVAALNEKADIADVPTKTSQLENDRGFLTAHQSLVAYQTKMINDAGGYFETDTVESALQEIGEILAAGGGDIEGAVWGKISGTLSDQTDLKNALDGKADTEDIPTKTSDLYNDSGYLTAHQSLTAYRTAAAQDLIDAGKLASSLKGASGGLAELDASGKVPTSQLPASAESIVEYASQSLFPETGERGRIYIDILHNTGYRWTGTDYIAIATGLALGETSTTAYRGDRGKTAYEHSQNSTVHVTQAQKNAWDAKADTEDIPTKTSQLENNSGYLTEHQSLSAYRTAAAQDTIDAGKLASSLKGANGGLAELDASGKVPTSQLPASAESIVEYASKSQFPVTGERGKIYIDILHNTGYRWTGTDYIAIATGLALGETSTTAYRGDRGKTAYEHSQNSTVHVTQAQKNAWDAKADTDDIPTVDSQLSTTSVNPVQNKVITAALQQYQSSAINDAGGYFTTDTVEAALQEIGAELFAVSALIGDGVIT